MNVTVDSLSISPISMPVSHKISIEVPGKCPVCGTAYAQIPEIVRHYESEKGSCMAYAIFFCPNCEECFFVSYIVLEDPEESLGKIFSIFPHSNKKTVFPRSIKSLSPDFVEIYDQSEQAENQNLLEICGMGYRKALEFLVKDYACSKRPDQREKIEVLTLSQCILDYIDNEKIKTLATASAWLGNDETHYIRKHQTYGVQDLKRFIKTVVAFISYELNYEEAFALLSTPR